MKFLRLIYLFPSNSTQPRHLNKPIFVIILLKCSMSVVACTLTPIQILGFGNCPYYTYVVFEKLSIHKLHTFCSTGFIRGNIFKFGLQCAQDTYFGKKIAKIDLAVEDWSTQTTITKTTTIDRKYF